MLDDATPDTFRPHVGTTFSIEVEDGEPLVLTLEEANPHGAGHEFRQQPFSLVFSGPQDRLATQGNYLLRHPALGDFVLFMVPIGPGRYEVVFN